MRPLPAVTAAAFLSLFAQSLRADIGATATLSLDSFSSDTATYNYTITVQNTGATDIGTFWYAWQPGMNGNPDYNFMASFPTLSDAPAGWYSYVTGGSYLYNYYGSGFSGYDGYGIEWYTLGGSPIAPGDSATFSFSSPDSPDLLAGDSANHPGIPTQTSYVYIGYAEADPGASFVVAPAASPAPEPTSLSLLACGLIPLLRRSRKPA